MITGIPVDSIFDMLLRHIDKSISDKVHINLDGLICSKIDEETYSPVWWSLRNNVYNNTIMKVDMK